MKKLEKSQMTSIYGGREVEKTEGTYDGTCYNDKIITKNNGSIKVKIKPC